MLDVRPAASDADLARIAAIVGVVMPGFPTSVTSMRWSDEHYPGGRRFLAWLDGVAVGSGGVGRMYIYPESFDGLWGSISVLPEHRRRGVGGAILSAIEEATRQAGKSMLLGRTTSDQPQASAFLEHRGFREYERMKAVRLDLAGVVPPAPSPPDGVTLTSLAERPDLVDGIYAVAVEAWPDIPGEGPVAPGSLEEFRVLEVDRPTIPAGGYVVALDAATDRVIGYAYLQVLDGKPTVAWHGMTAVARAWRGRGVAGALKRATIAWGASNGLEALETANDVDNAPMRAINRRLGYQPLPDEIYVRGRVRAA